MTFRQNIRWWFPVVLTLASGGYGLDGQTQKPVPSIPKGANYSLLRITSSDNVELMLIDSLGRRIGRDPQTGQTYQEIPESDYGTEIIPGSSGKQIKLLSVNRPYPGRYGLRVTGMKASSYTLIMEGNSADNRYKTNISLAERLIARNEIHSYQFSYNQSPNWYPKPLLVRIVKP